MMKNTIKIILTVLIVVAVVFVFNGVYKNKNQILSSKLLEIIKEKIGGTTEKRACGKIVGYSIGDVDESFGLSEEQFLAAVKEAEDLWEKGVGRDLFEYKRIGGLDVNLVFDERQSETTRMREILDGISSDEDKLKAAKAEYDRLSAQVKEREATFNSNWDSYEKAQAKFEALVTLYNSKIASYEKQANYWRDKGGTPKKEYEQLVQEKADIDNLFIELSSQQEALKSTVQILEVQRTEFNNLVSQVNTIAGIFNRLAEKLNVRVVSYNEVQGLRDEFISGLYTSDAMDETIDIFQFYDNKDLVVTLAHELGHALGLGHATTTYAVMYPKSEGQKTELNLEDIQMVDVLCR